jgi:2-polyprenyl-3-methyl-5-hydroxy-6-metoxy-1,4-benzoquinol methylase
MRSGTRPCEEFIHVNQFYSVRFLKEHANRYIFAARYARDKVVLDVACGVGYGSYYLRRSARRVIAGDISAEALSSASNRFGEDIEYVRLDAQNLPFQDGAFEVICSFETIEHLSDHHRFLAECLRCLRPGGALLCSTPNKAVSSPGRSGTSSSFHTREFYAYEVCELVARYFPHFELGSSGNRVGN